MTPTLILLLAAGALAIIVAGAAVASMLQRRDVLLRATEEHGALQVPSVVLRKEKHGKLQDRLEELAKSQQENAAVQTKLIQAGYDGPTAPAVFFLLRTSSAVLVPLLGFLIIPPVASTIFALGMLVALFIGFLLPVAMLDRMVRLRQERITKSVPDALDLLVVCVEAGVSLDAAILRVARELKLPHPDLAYELAVVNRLTNAGMPRETALRGLWQRTGVIEIRTLVSSMIQSEKWGTSIATILRVAAETLRRKRRQAAEKQAKMAPLKMTFPLLLFILPALFVVILGPAVVQIIREFGRI